MSKYYFAYGNEMDADQMTEYCSSAKFIGTAQVAGYHVVFKGFPSGHYAAMEEEADSLVYGVVWEIDDAEEDGLDRAHGIPNIYDKGDMTVTVDGKEYACLTYVMPADRAYGLPRASYYNKMEAAFAKYGFPKPVIDKTLSFTRAKVAPRRRAVIHM